MKKRTVLGLAALCVLTMNVMAATIDWDVGVGDWATGANWDGDVVPGANDFAQIGMDGIATISSDVGSIAGFDVEGSLGSLEISTGGQLISSNSANKVRIGSYTAGALTMSGGSLSVTTNGLQIGLGNGSQGSSLTINGGLVETYGIHGYYRFDLEVAVNSGTDGTITINDGTLYAPGVSMAVYNRSATLTTAMLNINGGTVSVPGYFYAGMEGSATIVQTNGNFICGTNGVGLAIGGYDDDSGTLASDSSGHYTISGGLMDINSAISNELFGLRIGGFGGTYVAAGTLRVEGGAATINAENLRFPYGMNGGVEVCLGTLELEIDATGVSTINVDGDPGVGRGVASLGGTLEVIDSGAAEGTYDIITTTGSVTGKFDTVVLPGSDWGVVYGANKVSLIKGKPSIISLTPSGSGVVEMVFDCPAPSLLYPYKKTDLVIGSWINVPHANVSGGTYATTNLSYSTPVSGTTNKIYLQTTIDDVAFFGIGE